jgi:hypothetical protein
VKEESAAKKRKTASTKTDQAPKMTTVTCMHCRYEYPADAPRCTICGYPWPWLK